jgi:hypothetical protein
VSGKESVPLGSHEYFAQWASPHAWSSGTVSFGSSVIDDLVDGITKFAVQARQSSYRQWASSAAVGCVPWMNHPGLIESLASLEGCCIVMTKGAGDLMGARALQASGRPLAAQYLPNFNEVGFVGKDGSPPVIGPYGMEGETVEDLGPVRLAGWRGTRNDRSLPLLHAKLLVLGDAWGYDNDDDPPWGPQFRFAPRRAWLGSANWTRGATKALEFGVWVDEPTLVKHVLTLFLMSSDSRKRSKRCLTIRIQSLPKLRMTTKRCLSTCGKCVTSLTMKMISQTRRGAIVEWAAVEV